MKVSFVEEKTLFKISGRFNTKSTVDIWVWISKLYEIISTIKTPIAK